MKPRIGINLDVDEKKTTVYKVNRAYVQAILLSGATPVLVPPCDNAQMESYCRDLQGFIFIGGPDYSPKRYGKRTNSTVHPAHPEREEFDFRLYDYILTKTKIPVLFICLGIQGMNLYYGGSLFVDIARAFPGRGLKHRSSKGIPAASHPVAVVSRSQLMRIYRRKIIASVLSSHHQAIDRLGKDLTVVGLSPDGIVEAIAHTKRPFTIGVQWHPEQDYEGNKRLFMAFIRAARETR